MNLAKALDMTLQTQHLRPRAPQIADRRNQVAQLYTEGLSQNAIAEALQVSIATVSLDLKALREDWSVNARMGIDERKAMELGKLDNLEAECWDAWYRSREDLAVSKKVIETVPVPIVSSKNPAGGKGNKFNKKGKDTVVGSSTVTLKMVEEKVLKGQVGDPRYLQQIAWCIEMRVKLMKIIDDRPINNNVTVIKWDQLFGRPEHQNIIESKLEQATLVGAPILDEGIHNA